MTLKDSIENNPVLWTLGMLLTGFLAGIGTYHWGLDFVGRRLVPQAAVVLQNNETAVLTTEYTRLKRLEEEVEPIKARENFYRTFLTYVVFKNHPFLTDQARAKNKSALVDWISRNYQATVSGSLSEQEAHIAIIKKGNDWVSGTTKLKDDPTEWPIPKEINEAVHKLNQ